MIYVQKDEMIYEMNLDDLQSYSDDISEFYIPIQLVLVAGRDYIAPDYSDDYGWTESVAFAESVQHQYLHQYVYSESLQDVLDSEGFQILREEDLPTVYAYGIYPLEAVEVF